MQLLEMLVGILLASAVVGILMAVALVILAPGKSFRTR